MCTAEKKNANKEEEFEMLAVHSYKTLRVTKENIKEFEELSSKSEQQFSEFLEKNNLLTQESKKDDTKE